MLAQPPQSKTEALERQAGERLQTLQREAERLTSEEQTLLGDLRRLELDRQIKAEQFRKADAEVRAVSQQIDRTAERMRELQQRDHDERPILAARLVDIYKLGQGRYLRLLLSASDVRRFGEAMRTVAALAALDRTRVAAHQQTLAELTSTRDQLEQRRRQLEALRADAARAQVAADRAAAARNDRIRDIDQRRDLNAQFAGELQGAQQKLQGMLKDLGNTMTSGPAAALPLRPFQGDLDWPSDGPVRRKFNEAGSGSAPSNGILITAAEGTPALAIHGGVVAFADSFSGFGNLIILDHGSQAFSLYGNLLELFVKSGAHVEKGQTVGTVGPAPAGPAGLYFGLRIDGQPVDPLQWLKARK